jgi:hypothetical protein
MEAAPVKHIVAAFHAHRPIKSNKCVWVIILAASVNYPTAKRLLIVRHQWKE